MADSRDEALELLKDDDKWNIEELKRIEPIVNPLDKPSVVSKLIYFG